MTWKCKNEQCGKTFEIPARLTTRETMLAEQFPTNKKEEIIEKACCPFCLSISFEEVKETTTE